MGRGGVYRIGKTSTTGAQIFFGVSRSIAAVDELTLVLYQNRVIVGADLLLGISVSNSFTWWPKVIVARKTSCRFAHPATINQSAPV